MKKCCLFFFENNGPRANARPPANSDSKEKAWNDRVKQLFLFAKLKKISGKEVKKMVCKCRNNMFLSLCHPYVSQSRWRLVFLTPEKYSNSQISVKDWIDIRCRIEQENLLSSYRKLLRYESYVSVEDSFIVHEKMRNPKINTIQRVRPENPKKNIQSNPSGPKIREKPTIQRALLACRLPRKCSIFA